MSIVEQVRAQKEAAAAVHDFDIARIISAAQERQEKSGRKIIRQLEQEGSVPSVHIDESKSPV